MNHDIKIAGATYSDVPAIKLKDTNGNEIKFIDPSDATASAADISAGKTAYGAAGELITGTASGGSSVNYFKKIVCAAAPFNTLGDTIIDGGTQLAGLYFVRNLNSKTIKKIFPAAFYNSGLITRVDCQALEEIGDHAFYWCDSLESFNFSSVKKIESFGLTHTIISGVVRLPNIVEINSNAFDSSRKITTLDIGEKCTNIGANLWGSMVPSTLTIVCRATTPPDLSGTLFYSWLIPKTFKIYVPDASVDTYKAATNWSTYADNINALSSYTG